MGQAKQRQAEIAALKAKPAQNYGILAIRHGEDGLKEYTYFDASYINPKNDRNALLGRICSNHWLHTPPANFIAEYLFQTKTFNMMKQFGLAESFILNFYEMDKEFSAENGKKTFSCRDIAGGSRESVQAHVDDLVNELAADARYSHKFNHAI